MDNKNKSREYAAKRNVATAVVDSNGNLFAITPNVFSATVLSDRLNYLYNTSTRPATKADLSFMKNRLGSMGENL